MGRDYEHCQELQRKVGDVHDVSVRHTPSDMWTLWRLWRLWRVRCASHYLVTRCVCVCAVRFRESCWLCRAQALDSGLRLRLRPTLRNSRASVSVCQGVLAVQAVSGCVRLCQAVSASISVCQRLSASVSVCQRLSECIGCVRLCQAVSGCVRLCQAVSASVSVCQCLSASVRVYWLLRLCQAVSASVRVCRLCSGCEGRRQANRSHQPLG